MLIDDHEIFKTNKVPINPMHTAKYRIGPIAIPRNNAVKTTTHNGAVNRPARPCEIGKNASAEKYHITPAIIAKFLRKTHFQRFGKICPKPKNATITRIGTAIEARKILNCQIPISCAKSGIELSITPKTAIDAMIDITAALGFEEFVCVMGFSLLNLQG